MSKAKIKINSILGGQAPTKYFSNEDQYNSSIAIDPDYPIGSETKTSGAIVPTRYSTFSSTEIADYPMWFMTNPKNAYVYSYTEDGSVVRYSDTLGSETDIGTPTNGNGSGGAYYNNYLYFASTTDISRYGPLSDTPSLTNTFWTGTLGLTALTDTTYPSIRGVEIPNHAMHVHSNNILYVADFKDGQGFLNGVSTMKDTYEGEIDDVTFPSAYNVLDLPFGYYPTDIESYGTDLVILAIATTDDTLNQGKSALFFWDTTSASFYRQVMIADPLATALLNVNGVIYIFSGNAQNGCMISMYAGGDSTTEVTYLEEGTPPFAGAVDAWSGRIYFGNWTTYPASTASIFAFGSKTANIPQGLHNVARSTYTSGGTPTITAVKAVLQADNKTPNIIVGWGDGTNYKIDKKATSGTFASVWRSQFYNIGQKFKIEKIRIPLATAVANNVTITPKVYLDDDVTTGTALTVINNTNYSGQKSVIYKMPELELTGNHNFMLELSITGSVASEVVFPITFELDIIDDE